MIQEQSRIRPAVYGIGLYLLLAAADSFRIGSLGSILKIVALIPVALFLLDLKKLYLRFHPVLVIQLIFWLLSIFSLFFTVNTQKTIYAVLTLTLNLMLTLALGSLEIFSKRELQLMQRALQLGGWVTIFLMLVTSDFSAGGRLTLRLGESTQDQNYINGFFIYTFSYHFQRLLEKSEKKQLFPVFLILAIVLMTGSRGALLAYAITGFVHICVLLSHSHNRVRNIILAVVVLILTGVLFDVILGFMPEQVAMRFSWDYIAEKGTTGRIKVWRFLLQHFSQDNLFRMLFGHGYGTSQYINTINGNVAHNLYIDNLITLGISGLLVQLATQGTICWILLQRQKYTLFATYAGMLCMCLSLSLVAYKPIWNVMLLTLAIDLHCRATDSDSTIMGGNERVL